MEEIMTDKSMRPFLRLWLGQSISIIGTGMTMFALAIWIWNQTGEVTAVVLTTSFFFLPTVLLGPFAGVLIDRWNRKTLMLACDTVAGFTSLLLCLLFLSGTLQIWHLYFAAMLSGTFQCLQIPTLMASVSTLVSKEKCMKATCLLSLSDCASQILAPALAALLYALIAVSGILLIDIATFVIAIALTLSVINPRPESTDVGQKSKGTVLQESIFGFRFVFEHRSLLYLLFFIISVNIVLELWASFLSPMILARTGNDSSLLGWVQAAGGVGAVVGGILVSRLQSPKNFMPRLLLSIGLMGILTLPIGFKDAIALWIVAHFFFFFMHTFLSTYHQAIWQTKVPQDVQGRVFAIRRIATGLSAFFAPMMLGYMADHVFEPRIATSGLLHNSLSWLVGSEQGDGLAAMFVLGGIMLAVLATGAYLVPTLRNLENRLSASQLFAQPAAIRSEA
jgi:MFS family permease